ncbi:hypothetical protein ABZP36_003304 [Zizania latifolia]
MRAHGLAMAVLVIVAVLSSGPGVLAVRIPAVFAETRSRGASLAERPRELAEGGNAVVDASVMPAAAAAAGSSPSTVFDPDRMSKRRVRRGSDPIHNKC